MLFLYNFVSLQCQALLDFNGSYRIYSIKRRGVYSTFGDSSVAFILNSLTSLFNFMQTRNRTLRISRLLILFRVRLHEPGLAANPGHDASDCLHPPSDPSQPVLAETQVDPPRWVEKVLKSTQKIM